MSDHWEFYRTEWQGYAASVFVDVGIHDPIPDLARPVCRLVQVTMKLPRPDGLSSKEEYAGLVAFEDVLMAALGSFAYVGRITSNGRRSYFLYGARSAPEERIKPVCDEHGYAFEVGSSVDPGWQGYLNAFYPKEHDWQVISDRHVIESLEKNGEKFTRNRDIEHVVIFETQAQLEAFLGDLAPEWGYAVTRREAEPGSALVVHRDIPRFPQICTHTLRLYDLARKHGGTYDGWGCEVWSE
jgi:hypothetical protein